MRDNTPRIKVKLTMYPTKTWGDIKCFRWVSKFWSTTCQCSQWGLVTQSLVLRVGFVDSFLSFFCWPLCCLSFFDMQILITPLVFTRKYQNKMNLYVVIFIVFYRTKTKGCRGRDRMVVGFTNIYAINQCLSLLTL